MLNFAQKKIKDSYLKNEGKILLTCTFSMFAIILVLLDQIFNFIH